MSSTDAKTKKGEHNVRFRKWQLLAFSLTYLGTAPFLCRPLHVCFFILCALLAPSLHELPLEQEKLRGYQRKVEALNSCTSGLFLPQILSISSCCLDIHTHSPQLVDISSCRWERLSTSLTIFVNFYVLFSSGCSSCRNYRHKYIMCVGVFVFSNWMVTI